jgi:hypothetical protein
VYFSAATFFTLGAGEPGNPASRYLMVLEAGFGYSFLGLVIGYLPVLYQSFSERELRILLLDARAGTPPTAAQFVLRRGSDPARLEKRLAEWEEWALDLLQDHLSYPMLAFYRSQHANQSWLAALTAVADGQRARDARCRRRSPAKGPVYFRSGTPRPGPYGVDLRHPGRNWHG